MYRWNSEEFFFHPRSTVDMAEGYSIYFNSINNFIVYAMQMRNRHSEFTARRVSIDANNNYYRWKIKFMER